MPKQSSHAATSKSPMQDSIKLITKNLLIAHGYHKTTFR